MEAVDETVRLWNAKSDYHNFMIGRHGGMVTSVAFGPDGGLAVGGMDGTVGLWNINTSEVEKSRKQVLIAHLKGVTGVALSPDGAVLATGGLGWDDANVECCNG